MAEEDVQEDVVKKDDDDIESSRGGEKKAERLEQSRTMKAMM